MAAADLDMDNQTFSSDEEYNAYVAAYSLVTAATSLMLFAIGFADLASSMDKRVLKGFKTGCSFHILLGCLPDGLFLKGKKGMPPPSVTLHPTMGGATKTIKFLENLSPDSIDLEVTLIFICTFIVVRYFTKLWKSAPPGVNVLLPMSIATFYSFKSGYTGGVVGKFEMPSGAPIQYYPAHTFIPSALVPRAFTSVSSLILTATLFSAVNYMSVLAIIPALPPNDKKPSRNLLAQSFSSLASSFIGGPPIGASLSRTLTSLMFNVDSSSANLTIALVYFFGLRHLLPLVQHTPRSCLGGILAAAVFNAVFKARGLGAIGVITAVGVGVMSPNAGFAAGVAAWGLESALGGGKKKGE